MVRGKEGRCVPGASNGMGGVDDMVRGRRMKRSWLEIGGLVCAWVMVMWKEVWRT